MKLNLPKAPVKYKTENGQQYIYDSFRKKYLVNTPEEMVRQHFLHYLTGHLHYPTGRIAIEQGFDDRGNYRRADILVYDDRGDALILVECKAPHIKIGRKELDQIVVYNMYFRAKTLVLTNGLAHYYFQIDAQANRLVQLKSLENFK